MLLWFDTSLETLLIFFYISFLCIFSGIAGTTPVFVHIWWEFCNIKYFFKHKNVALKVICVGNKLTGYDKLYGIKIVTMKFKISIFGITFYAEAIIYVYGWAMVIYWYDSSSCNSKQPLSKRLNVVHVCKTAVCTAVSSGPGSGCYRALSSVSASKKLGHCPLCRSFTPAVTKVRSCPALPSSRVPEQSCRQKCHVIQKTGTPAPGCCLHHL